MWQHKSAAAFCQNDRTTSSVMSMNMWQEVHFDDWQQVTLSRQWTESSSPFLFSLAARCNSLKWSCKWWAVVQRSPDANKMWIDEMEIICQELFDEKCWSRENNFTEFHWLHKMFNVLFPSVMTEESLFALETSGRLSVIQTDHLASVLLLKWVLKLKWTA